MPVADVEHAKVEIAGTTRTERRATALVTLLVVAPYAAVPAAAAARTSEDLT